MSVNVYDYWALGCIQRQLQVIGMVHCNEIYVSHTVYGPVYFYLNQNILAWKKINTCTVAADAMAGYIASHQVKSLATRSAG